MVNNFLNPKNTMGILILSKYTLLPYHINSVQIYHVNIQTFEILVTICQQILKCQKKDFFSFFDTLRTFELFGTILRL